MDGNRANARCVGGTLNPQRVDDMGQSIRSARRRPNGPVSHAS